MKRTIILTTILAFLLVTAGAFTYAQRERENRRNNMPGKMIEELNLTDQQQTRIEEIRFAHQEKMIDLKADVEKKKLGLKELQTTADFSRSDYIANIEGIIAA
jgi:Spy/CpxP family protein refolding chaperone